MARQSVTLDFAEESFMNAPDNKRAARLLTIATEYWNASRIEDETFADKVRRVRDWLADFKEME